MAQITFENSNSKTIKEERAELGNVDEKPESFLQKMTKLGVTVITPIAKANVNVIKEENKDIQHINDQDFEQVFIENQDVSYKMHSNAVHDERNERKPLSCNTCQKRYSSEKSL